MAILVAVVVASTSTAAACFLQCSIIVSSQENGPQYLATIPIVWTTIRTTTTMVSQQHFRSPHCFFQSCLPPACAGCERRLWRMKTWMILMVAPDDQGIRYLHPVFV
jgi:hypothetical protein